MARGRKTGGRDFKPGENGGVRRGPDRIPRGSVKALYQHFMESDDVEILYASIRKAAADPRLALHLAQNIADRLHGRPTQAIEVQAKRETIFHLSPTARPKPRSGSELTSSPHSEALPEEVPLRMDWESLGDRPTGTNSR